MKKTYIEPQAVVIKVGVSSVLCGSGGSLGLGGNASDAGVTSGDSRGYDDWDED